MLKEVFHYFLLPPLVLGMYISLTVLQRLLKTMASVLLKCYREA